MENPGWNKTTPLGPVHLRLKSSSKICVLIDSRNSSGVRPPVRFNIGELVFRHIIWNSSASIAPQTLGQSRSRAPVAKDIGDLRFQCRRQLASAGTAAADH